MAFECAVTVCSSAPVTISVTRAVLSTSETVSTISIKTPHEGLLAFGTGADVSIVVAHAENVFRVNVARFGDGLQIN
jgi:hypothetical protein